MNDAASNLDALRSTVAALTADLPKLPPRPDGGHKGTFGTVLVLGGCDCNGQMMIGAPALTALAALRSGCGLVKLAMPETVLPSAIVLAPGATGVPLPQRATDRQLQPSAAAARLDEAIESGRIACLALGPGLGVGFEQQQVLVRLVARDETPVVVDADGLNNLAETPDFAADFHAPAVLTPHPGEFARLANALGISASATDAAERPQAAAMLAQRLGCVVVLKGADTIVSDGASHWNAQYRNPVLATAGTGDVLTGVLASLISQFYKPHLGPLTPERQGGLGLFDIARWAVALHATAAEHWSCKHGRSGMLATDLANELPAARVAVERARQSD